MVDDADLRGLDPYDLMEAEAARLDRFFVGLDTNDWARPSRCAGWSVRDVLAHLLSSEQYNRASLDGTVADFIASVGARGASDIESLNQLGIRDLDGRHFARTIQAAQIGGGSETELGRVHGVPPQPALGPRHVHLRAGAR